MFQLRFNSLSPELNFVSFSGIQYSLNALSHSRKRAGMLLGW